ncbi:MAG: SUMF1/EgtB/PvdO family nonheme iron enzyme [Polyangiaceae bacterium]|nr:SUMF1/EgtB/PvdO family nonheme iron enzyme [Polyangiaceae bacterium]
MFRGETGTLEPHPHFLRPAPGVKYEARSEPGVKPQGYISRTESISACSNAGKRLCSVSEWYAACSGSRHTTYPYGPKYEKRVCNVSRPHLLTKFFGSNARAWKYDEHFNNPKLNQLQGWLANTGAFAGCTSDYGVSDMVGNLHEWVADQASAEAVREVPLRPEIRRALVPHRSGRGVFMGGFYSTGSEHGDGCTFVTMAHEPSYHDYSTGFRCCKDL